MKKKSNQWFVHMYKYPVVCIYTCIYNTLFHAQSVASNLCEHYRSLCGDEDHKKAFFAVLAGDLGVNHDSILSGAQNLCELHNHVSNMGKKKFL